MKSNTCILIDCWEGSLEIDEPVLKTGGVKGFIIRLNNMSGGHHLDKNFHAQWTQAAGFARAAYFVFNPWVSGQANYDWLLANCPADVRCVFIDVEVRYDQITPAQYTAEVQRFLALASLKWRTPIYTGQGFIDLLATWPRTEYWWACYPAGNWATLKTWEQLSAELDKYDVPSNKQFVPGVLRMWQISGDKVILPGTMRTTDINVFYGNEAELRAWFGDTTTPIELPAPVGDLETRLAAIEAWRRS